MEAKELMYGDWYSALNGSFERDNYQFEFDLDYWDNAKPEPILLTPKMLEANGFRRDCANIWECAGNRYEPFLIRFDVEYSCVVIDYDGQYIDCSIKYVHQLQQTLRLCGLNDIADSIKI